MALSKRMKNIPVKTITKNKYTDISLLKEKLRNNVNKLEVDNEELNVFISDNVRTVANPLLMAFFIKDYELAEALLDKGYKVESDLTGSQIRLEDYQYDGFGDGFIGINKMQISITNCIIVDGNMPIKLLEKVLVCLSGKKPLFSFEKDILNNVILNNCSKKAWNVMFNNLKRIATLNPDYLKGMLSLGIDISVYTKFEQSVEYTYDTFLEVFAGKEELRSVIRSGITMFSDSGENDTYELMASLIKRKCDYDETIAFETLMIVSEAIASSQYDFFGYNRSNKYNEKLMKYLLKDNVSWDKVVSYIVNNYQNCSKAIEFIEFWKGILKEKFIFDRFNKDYLDLMSKIAKADKGTIFELDETSRINKINEFIQVIDGVKFKKYKFMKRYEEEILHKLLELKCEEIILMCIKKGFYFGDLLDFAIDKTLEQGYPEIAPIFICARNKEQKEVEKCIQ